MRRITTLLGALVVALAPLAVPAPAHASITGGLTFSCDANFPSYPSVRATGGTCTGTATLTATGTAADGRRVAVGGSGLPLRASFEYRTSCTAGEPLQDSIEGTLTVSDVPRLDGPGTATFRTRFSMQRTALVAVGFTHETVIIVGDGWVVVAERDDIIIVVVVFSAVPSCGGSGPASATFGGSDVVAA
jgi:hypothetical protein